jgi:2-phosphoglycolate phosphatase
MTSRRPGIDAVFFDLDGTLIDSAPDFIAAIRRLGAEVDDVAADFSKVGAVVSKGGRAMLRRGFPGADEARIDVLLPRFLDLYFADIAVHSRTYPGIDALLVALDARGTPWGIVTNKPDWLARELLQKLQLDKRCAALVSGDTLAVRKPDPAPLLHACELTRVVPARSVYLGDDARDIEAGRRAGMRTIAAAWGYLDGDDPDNWGADQVLNTPDQVLAALAFI